MINYLKKLPLVEKFGPTIQGEGATIGLQTYFLRFGLCDYECVMCDSMHAVDPKSVKLNATWMTQDEIAKLFKTDEGRESLCHWITLSGGNPCIHDLDRLVRTLREMQYRIAVETQGTFCPTWLHQCDIITVSPKGPGMGEKFEPQKYKHFISNLTRKVGINTKVVIFTRDDITFAEEVARLWINTGYSMNEFYLSQGNPFPPGKGPPVNGDMHVKVLRDKYLELFDIIKTSPILTHAKWLPQWHVWLWSNLQGV